MAQPSVVSALISTYNAERWLRGRLDDLLRQTLYAQGRLELVLVISGSRQGEARIAREVLAAGVPLTLITSLREPIYAAWNRGIGVARGDYLTSANTDDRLRPDALERLADVLDADPTVGVVYADSLVTDTVNGTWEAHHRCTDPPYLRGALAWGAFAPEKLAAYCCVGPCPVWRAALHPACGRFDASYQLAGDYEFWLRLAARGVGFRHLDDTLSLFYHGGSTRQHQAFSDLEARRALLTWRRHLEPVHA